MKLLEVERQLHSIISDYIRRAYPSLSDKLVPKIVCLDSHQFKQEFRIRDRKSRVLGGYQIQENAVYFRQLPRDDWQFTELPMPQVILHEMEHWAQCQRIGKEAFIEKLQNETNFLKCDREAIDVSISNRPLLNMPEKAEETKPTISSFKRWERQGKEAKLQRQ